MHSCVRLTSFFDISYFSIVLLIECDAEHFGYGSLKCLCLRVAISKNI